MACLSGHGLGLRAAAVLLAAALLGACGALAASATAPSDSATRGADMPGEAQAAARSPIVMYLARRNWHIDVGFSVRELDPSLAVIARRFPRVDHCCQCRRIWRDDGVFTEPPLQT